MKIRSVGAELFHEATDRHRDRQTDRDSETDGHRDRHRDRQTGRSQQSLLAIVPTRLKKATLFNHHIITQFVQPLRAD
jgi:hypothetical protein